MFTADFYTTAGNCSGIFTPLNFTDATCTILPESNVSTIFTLINATYVSVLYVLPTLTLLTLSLSRNHPPLNLLHSPHSLSLSPHFTLLTLSPPSLPHPLTPHSLPYSLTLLRSSSLLFLNNCSQDLRGLHKLHRKHLHRVRHPQRRVHANKHHRVNKCSLGHATD